MPGLNPLGNFKRLAWAIFAALIVSAYSLAPQIYLWSEKGDAWNGVYAFHDFDEPSYAAYIQSLIDGKPRINSPYTGSPEPNGSVQNESLFSIQFVAFYPIAVLSRMLGLNSSGAMILMSGLTGFLTGLALFWLFALFFDSPFLSFVGAIFVIAIAALIAGQGSIIAGYDPARIYPFIALPTIGRRAVPAAGFPVLILFLGLAWKLLSNPERRIKAVWTSLAVISFSWLVFTYFYLWTAAAAWLAVVITLWFFIRPHERRSHVTRMIILGAVMATALIPYALRLMDRGDTIDSAQLVDHTRQLDLWRISEVLSIAAIVGILVAGKLGKIDISEPKTVFILSLFLVPLVVFNQQIVTGRSLQPFHYELYVTNYFVAFSATVLIFRLLDHKLSISLRRVMLIVLLIVAIVISYSDARFAQEKMGAMNVARDELVPVLERIRELSKQSTKTSTVLSFDYYQSTDGPHVNVSDEMPALSSQAPLWSTHQYTFSDLTPEQGVIRLLTTLHYQNLDTVWLEDALRIERFELIGGLFGWGRHGKVLTTAAGR